VIKLLLADPMTDLGLRNASFEGDDFVVKLLLADPWVNPAADNNFAIRQASANGHVSVVTLLLADPRVDPAACYNDAIRGALFYAHESVVELLLAHPRVDPTADNNKAIRDASYNGHASIVKLLLADQRVDPSMGHPTALECASRKGHVAIVQLLLEHPKVVVTKAALVAADQLYDYDIVPMLIEKQPRVLEDLFEGATSYMPDGALVDGLHQWEKASALTFLLAGERCGCFFRVSDVLREVMLEYACFDLIENTAD
jgi:ankyrin repeat protein